MISTKKLQLSNLFNGIDKNKKNQSLFIIKINIVYILHIKETTSFSFFGLDFSF